MSHEKLFKCCPYCKETKPFELFVDSKFAPSGKGSSCLSCASLENLTEKKCKKCQESKLLKLFRLDNRGIFIPRCKKCTYADMKVRRRKKLLESRGFINKNKMWRPSANTIRCCRCQIEKSKADFNLPDIISFHRFAFKCKLCEIQTKEN